MADEDVTPEVEGHAEPDTGGGEGVESELPVGVDGLTDAQIAQAEEAGPADGGGGEDGGDGGALDVSALMDDSGDAGDAGDEAGDEGDEGDAGDDADADATPDDDVAEPDNSGEEA